MNEALIGLDSKIKSNTILFFDLDGTLIDTDYANYLAYKKAIDDVLKVDFNIEYSAEERFNRDKLKKIFKSLSPNDYQQIVVLKEEYYKDYLSETKLNNFISDILIKYYISNVTALVTNCREDRALITLDYHKLTDKFSFIFCRETLQNSGLKINKYENAILNLKILPKSILVFENEKSEIDDAVLAGISINNIININHTLHNEKYSN